jgi:hypothetical protein
MKNLYLSKGGTLEDGRFNGVNVTLTNEDLDALEKAVIGVSKPLEEARNALKEGHKVYYYSITFDDSVLNF